MASLTDPTRIATNYFKLAHFSQLSYTVFGPVSSGTASVDQSLLELELVIRSRFPDILATYYNKRLYCFQFGHNLAFSIAGLLEEFPIKPIYSNVVNVDVLVNPPKPSKVDPAAAAVAAIQGNAESPGSAGNGDEYLPFLLLTFLKAVKKLILFRLSMSHSLQLFGNHAVIGGGNAHHIVHIDPLLLPNGDLLVCITNKRTLTLFASSISAAPTASGPAIAEPFVIYLMPSGIRCHLYHSDVIASNFTYVPPKNADSIVLLYELSTGVLLNKQLQLKQLLWVKLIPNLQHLNNQTSTIARFIHTVDNKKFIFWPWELCLLQYGHKTLQNGDSTFLRNEPTADTIEPLLLVLEFMDFTISQHQKQAVQPTTSAANHHSSQQFSVASVHLQAATVGPDAPGAAGEVGAGTDALDIASAGFLAANGVPGPESMVIDLTKAEVSEKAAEQGQDGQEGEEVEDEEELDDLFGGGSNSDLEQNDYGVFDLPKEEGDAKAVEREEVSINTQGNNSKEASPNDLEIKPEESQDLQNNDDIALGLGLDINMPKSESPVISNAENKPYSANDANANGNNGDSTINTSYFDIPKDQMTINPSKSSLKPKTPYSDPGAPIPILATPFIFQTTAFGANHPSGPNSALDTDDQTKSIFLPLLFNPIIKSNIDNKYGRGGKFYVEKETTSIPPKRRSIRATSVIGYEREESANPSGFEMLAADRTAPLVENVIEDESIDEDEDEEEEESDEDEEDNTEKLSTPLKLNVHSQQIQSSEAHMAPYASRSSAATNQAYNNQMQSFMQAESTKAPFTYPLETSATFDDSEVSPNASIAPQSAKLDLPFGNLGGAWPGAEGIFSLNVVSAMSSPIEQEMLPSFVKEILDYEDEIMEDPIEVKHTSQTPDVQDKAHELPHSRDSAPFVQNNAGNSGSGSEKVLAENTPGTSLSSSSMSESSNCLPLILRCINVSTIPNVFIPNHALHSGTNPSNDFMYVEEDGDNIWHDMYSNSMLVKLANLDEFLHWLTSSIVFDMGMNTKKIQNQLKLQVCESSPEVEKEIDGRLDGFELNFLGLFPNSYRVNLIEFIGDFNEPEKKLSNSSEKGSGSADLELENQLKFLDDITDDIMLNPVSQLKKLKTLDWDSIYTGNFQNDEVSKEYKRIIETSIASKYSSLNETDHENQDSTAAKEDFLKLYFTLPSSKAKVHKQKNSIVNLNSLGLNFWQYLKLSPVNGPKNFQMVMISESVEFHLDCNYQFLTNIVYNYEGCRLGNISPLNLFSSSSSDQDNISGGIIPINRGPDYYEQINKRLTSLAEMIRLNLINKNNQFEFDRPLLLFFVDFDESISSLVKIAKLCRNFKLSLLQHQVPLVEVFSHVIPSSRIFKSGYGNLRRLRYLSNLKLTKISMNLYNNCPDTHQYRGGRTIHTNSNRHASIRSNFTQLVNELPTRIDFKMGLKDGGHGGANGSFNGEVFLHLAYERSIDRNWMVASWSDSLGQVTHTKSWFCSLQKKKGGCHDLGEICDQIWDVSLELFNKLNQNIVKEMSGFGGKKFLVLTRINSIIPDDELVHWKRLSLKHKEVSLVVLSVNDNPKLLFKYDQKVSDIKEENFAIPSNDELQAAPEENVLDVVGSVDSRTSESDFFKTYSMPESNNPSPNAVGVMMSTSPFNGTGLNFHSPQQFSNAPANFLSQQDFLTFKNSYSNQITGNNDKMNMQVLIDPRDDIQAVLPKIPLPSFNSPTRLGMKIGYLLKEVFGPEHKDNNVLVYEINLLSCSNYWNLNSIMHIILKQYKNLITLNDILGVRDSSGVETDEINHSVSGLVPWHVAAVTKTLEYLVHIEVDE